MAATGSEAVVRLRDELLAYPGVPSGGEAPDALSPIPPLVSMQMRKGDLSMAFFSMITDVRDAARRHAPAAEDRVLLPGGRVHGADGPPPRGGAGTNRRRSRIVVLARLPNH